MKNVKQEAKKLIDRLPEKVTWDDIMYNLYVKQKIEMGIQAAEAGRTIPHERVKKMFPSS